MKKICVLSLFFMLLSVSVCGAEFDVALKYHNAGTFKHWTEEAYYSSPYVGDIDYDGEDEIVFSNYTITVLDAKTGEVEWKVNSGRDRNSAVEEFGVSNGHTWSDVEVADINGDGKKEIITAHGQGLISVLSADGYFMPGWPQTPVDASARSVVVADLDNDGFMEIIVGYGVGGRKSVYVFNHDGKVRSGWPQLQGENGDRSWMYGVFMDSIEAADLDGDGLKEVIIPSDLSHISVFRHNGVPFEANERVYGEKMAWGHIALFEDYASEIRNENGGWGNPVEGDELREELYKGEFGHGKAKAYDFDGDGKKEIVVTTIMCNRKYAPVYPPTEYMTVAILNSDRTRFESLDGKYNWEVLPMDLGKPLVQNDNNVSSGVYQNPTICDIDNDGSSEILFNSYNGKVHCFSLDKTEPYAWPFSLTKRSSPKFEYASPVVCVDIDGDGKKEIIFTSFYDSTQDYGDVSGNLYIVDYMGKVIVKEALPEGKEKGKYSNGGKAAPVVRDIDGDGAYEVVINTTNGGICVYDIK